MKTVEMNEKGVAVLVDTEVQGDTTLIRRYQQVGGEWVAYSRERIQNNVVAMSGFQSEAPMLNLTTHRLPKRIPKWTLL